MRVITWADPIPNEQRLIKQFLAYPEVIVHIRKPNFDLSQMMNFIAGFNDKEREGLVLHSYQMESEHWGFRRVHYPAQQRGTRTAERKSSCRISSTSTHNWDEFNQLDKVYKDAFLSPVFSSLSKIEYPENKELQATGRRSNFSTSLIALGGISSLNLQQVPKCYDDIALCGAIWLAADPMREFKACYQSALNKK